MKNFKQIISEHLKIPEKDVSDSLTMQNIPDWDSMNFLLLISDLEKEFNMTFAMDEVLAMQSIGDIANSIRSKGIQL